MSDDTLLTPRAAAAYLQIDEFALLRMREYGEGPRFIMDGKRVRYRKADLDAYIKNKLMWGTR